MFSASNAARCFALGMFAEGDDELVHRVPDLLIEYGALASERADGLAVVDPKHGACGETHEIEYARPEHAEFPSGSRHAVLVEGDVSGLIADDEPAHLGDGIIFPAAVFEHHLVIHVADDLRQDQRAELEAHAQEFPNEAEYGEAPVGLDFLATETLHGIAKKPRVLGFLKEPEIDKLPGVRAGEEFLPVPCGQVTRAAAVPEFELRERRQQGLDLVIGETGGCVPVRFHAVTLVVSEMVQPAVQVHVFHRHETEPAP